MVFRLLSVFSGLLLAFAAHAQGSPVEGVDYIELKPPQAVESSGKIEVLEFFWYRCPHCYALEPLLETWLKRLPKDVQFKRLPVVMGFSFDDSTVDARIFYTLEAMGEVQRLHKPLFDAIHQQDGVRLKGDAYAKWVAVWLAKQGVDMNKYDAAFRSFTVESKLRRAAQITQAYRLDGVPGLAVQGRYVVRASANMLNVTDHLIGDARKQLARSKP